MFIIKKPNIKRKMFNSCQLIVLLIWAQKEMLGLYTIVWGSYSEAFDS